jgi:hypothetical protein
MKKQLALMTAGAALTLSAGASGIAMSGTGHAEESPALRRGVTTETFTSRVLSSVPLSRTSSVEVAKDVAGGKAIGADTTVARFHARTGMVTGEFSFARKGGLLSGTFTLDPGTLAISGTIDSGEGRYAGVTGTLVGQAVNRKVTTVTLTYHR